MSYFKKFPVIDTYQIQGHELVGTNITLRTVVLSEARNNPANFIQYTVKDGETPIILADRLYSNSDWFWVILLFNEIHDINSGWPLSSWDLDRYVSRVYDDPQAIHHYESFYSGLVVDEDHPQEDRISITNYEYEIRLNEAKREMKIPTPEAAGAIVKEQRRLIP